MSASEAKRPDGRARRLREQTKEEQRDWAVEAPRAHASEAKRPDGRARRLREQTKEEQRDWAVEAPRAHASEAKRPDGRARRLREQTKEEQRDWAVEAPRAHASEAKRPDGRARRLREHKKRQNNTKIHPNEGLGDRASGLDFPCRSPFLSRWPVLARVNSVLAAPKRRGLFYLWSISILDDRRFPRREAFPGRGSTMRKEL